MKQKWKNNSSKKDTISGAYYEGMDKSLASTDHTREEPRKAAVGRRHHSWQ